MFTSSKTSRAIEPSDVRHNSWWHMKCAQHTTHNTKLKKMGLFRHPWWWPSNQNCQDTTYWLSLSYLASVTAAKLQLSCSDTCQIWMKFKGSSWYVTSSILNRYIKERRFSTLHPWQSKHEIQKTKQKTANSHIKTVIEMHWKVVYSWVPQVINL